MLARHVMFRFTLLPLCHRKQEWRGLAGDGTGHFRRGVFGYDLAAFVAGTRADIDDPVTLPGHKHIVFDHDDGITSVNQSVKLRQQKGPMAQNEFRLQLHALAYNLGVFLQGTDLPEEISDWSLTSLQIRLIKIGARVVRHESVRSSVYE